MAKPEYHGKDFFQRKEFRGLLLADYQEAIGEKAFACVDQLNTNTVSQFANLKSFRDSLGKKKLQDRFYKGEDGLNLKGSFSHRDSVVSAGNRSIVSTKVGNQTARHTEVALKKSVQHR